MAIPKPKPSLSKELFLNERIDGKEIGDVMNDEEGMANMRNRGQILDIGVTESSVDLIC